MNETENWLSELENKEPRSNRRTIVNILKHAEQKLVENLRHHEKQNFWIIVINEGKVTSIGNIFKKIIEKNSPKHTCARSTQGTK